AMPAQGEMMQVCIAQSGNRQLRDQSFQRLPMQPVQDDIAALRMLPDLVHRRGVYCTPAVDQRGPVRLDAALVAPFAEIRDQAAAPVHDGTEHVEYQCLHRRNIRHIDSLLPLTPERRPQNNLRYCMNPELSAT